MSTPGRPGATEATRPTACRRARCARSAAAIRNRSWSSSETAHPPPIYHPGALTAAVTNHRLAILASVPAVLIPLVMIGLTVALALVAPAVVAALILFCLLFGVLTAIPTRMILRTLPNYELDGWIAVPLAVAFPIWGSFLAMLSMGLLAPWTCTAAWCVALGPCLGRRKASQLWLVLAFGPVLAAAGVGLVMMSLTVAGVEIYVTATVVLGWLALHPFALALATELRRADLGFASGGCPRCGYSRAGLHRDRPCPECGLGGVIANLRTIFIRP